MSHTHHPNGAGPVCRYRTKRECDINWSAHQRLLKEAYEARQEERREEKRNRGQAAFEAYEAKQARRIAEGGPPV